MIEASRLSRGIRLELNKTMLSAIVDGGDDISSTH